MNIFFVILRVRWNSGTNFCNQRHLDEKIYGEKVGFEAESPEKLDKKRF